MTLPSPEQDDSTSPGRIEIRVGDINDVEAHLFAHYVEEPAERGETREFATLLGNVRGPYCEASRTLPAEFGFRQVGDGEAEAVISDPCQWSPDLPLVYHVSIEAVRGNQVLAEYDGPIGLRRTTPRRTGIEFPG